MKGLEGHCAAWLPLICNGLPTVKLMGRVSVTGSLGISKSNGRGADARGGSELLLNRVRNFDGRLLTAFSCSAPNEHPAHMPYLQRLNNYRSIDDVSLRGAAFITYKVESNPKNRRT